MTHKFTLNGQTYNTDANTVAVFRSIVPAAKESGDGSAVIALLELGLLTGHIVKELVEAA
jgi:hypothetical protein